jgi:uncharacterized alkaline shock family protein YloU
MKFFSGLTRFIFTVILSLLGICLIVIALNLLPKDDITGVINLIYSQPNLRLITGFAGLLLIAVSLIVLQFALSRMEREKTLAFDNPDGRVTVALTAIEDFMKKLGGQIPEIRELKPKVSARKKAVIIDTRVSLYSDISIPNITEKIQSLVKSRVQDMLGIEEPIVVRVHIGKLVNKEEPKKKKAKKDEKESQEVPQFRGIEYSES